MNQALRDDASAEEVIEFFEGVVGWMYLDTRAIATVGVGFAMQTASDVLSLPFTCEGREATDAEKLAEWKRVRNLRAGMTPAHYRDGFRLWMAPEVARQVLAKKLAVVRSELLRRLDWFAAAPLRVQTALLDMAWNLGLTGLIEGYPKLMLACKARAWAVASTQCGRSGPGPARNAWTRAQFQLAAKG